MLSEEIIEKLRSLNAARRDGQVTYYVNDSQSKIEIMISTGNIRLYPQKAEGEFLCAIANSCTDILDELEKLRAVAVITEHFLDGLTYDNQWPELEAMNKAIAAWRETQKP